MVALCSIVFTLHAQAQSNFLTPSSGSQRHRQPKLHTFLYSVGLQVAAHVAQAAPRLAKAHARSGG